MAFVVAARRYGFDGGDIGDGLCVSSVVVVADAAATSKDPLSLDFPTEGGDTTSGRRGPGNEKHISCSTRAHT